LTDGAQIGLVGYYGWGNLGDELFRETFQETLGKSVDLRVVHDQLEPPYFSSPVEDVVAETDAVLIGGGDLLVPWRWSPLYWNPAYRQRPVFVAGIGVPTWEDGKANVIERYRRWFADRAVRYIWLRDEASAEWVRRNLAPRAEVLTGPDVVYALELPPVAAAETGKSATPVLGVTARRAFPMESVELRAICDAGRAAGYAIRHIVAGTGSVGAEDAAVVERFRRPDEEVVRSESLADICRAIAGCTVVASSKFHVSVVATMYGVTPLVLSPTTKSVNLFGALGRPDLLIGPDVAGVRAALERQPEPVARDAVDEQVKGARAMLADLEERLGSVPRVAGTSGGRRGSPGAVTAGAGAVAVAARGALGRLIARGGPAGNGRSRS
jgi:polysaccharide pyruvyl transferase WcaK-like protein